MVIYSFQGLYYSLEIGAVCDLILVATYLPRLGNLKQLGLTFIMLSYNISDVIIWKNIKYASKLGVHYWQQGYSNWKSDPMLIKLLWETNIPVGPTGWFLLPYSVHTKLNFRRPAQSCWSMQSFV